MKLRNSQKQETIVTERKTKSKVYRKYQIDAKKTYEQNIALDKLKL